MNCNLQYLKYCTINILHILFLTYGQGQCEQKRRKGHNSKAVNKPRHPMDPIPQPHDPHGLLQPLFLLIDNRLDDHRGRINPSQGHEQGKCSGDGDDETVFDVTRIRHLLEGDSGQIGFVAAALHGNDRMFQHVLYSIDDLNFAIK